MALQQYWHSLKRHWLPAIAVFGSVVALSIVQLRAQAPIYEAQGKIRFTRADRTSAITGLAGGELGRFDPIVAENNPLTTEIKVMLSTPLLKATIEQLGLKGKQGKPMSMTELTSRLRIFSDRGTDILEISYRDADIEVTKAVVNTLMSVYLENHLRDNRAETVAAREFIAEQLPQAEADVRRAEAQLRQFKEANRVASLADESREMVTSLEALRRRVAEARSELASANSQVLAYQHQLQLQPQEAIAIASLSQSPGVQTVLSQLQEVDAELAKERVRFKDAHPMITALIDRRANLEAVLNQRISKILGKQRLRSTDNLQIGDLKADLIGEFVRAEVRRAGLFDQVTTLASTQAGYNWRIQQIPRLEQQQRELERKLEAAQATYSLLLQRFHEVRVAENQNVGNARIIQTASVGEQPVEPRATAFLSAGGIVGILLALATVFALESRDRSIRTIREAKNSFGYPVLSIIPYHKPASKFPFLSDGTESSHLIVQSEPNSPITELYRMLQANLKFLESDHRIKTVVVVSSVPNEGKSILSANLALAIAQLGQRVLLIDADLRAPSQHYLWHVSNDSGLTHVLAEHLDPQTTVKSVAQNLDLLTARVAAGVTPLNPVALLDSQPMADLVSSYGATYDFVLIDTPALNVAADALILGKMADGVLLVTRPGTVDYVNAAIAKERLEQSGQHILGQVIIGVVSGNDTAHYYLKEDAVKEDSAKDYYIKEYDLYYQTDLARSTVSSASSHSASSHSASSHSASSHSASSHGASDSNDSSSWR